MRLLIISLLILRVDIEKDKLNVAYTRCHNINAQFNENIRLQIKKDSKNEKLVVAFQLGKFAPLLYILLDIFCGTFSALTASP